MQTSHALVLMLAAGGAIGFGIPTDEEEMPALAALEAGMPAKAISHSEQAAAPVAQWAQEIALTRQGDGHFYADVTVDGFPARMLVDTGASVIALTGEDAAAMGLDWDEGAIAPLAQGANGPVMGVTTRLPHVALGEFEARNVNAIIVPEGLHISLLGQSFLSQIHSVNIAGDRMVLGN